MSNISINSTALDCKPNLQAAREHIADWVLGSLSMPHPRFAGFPPCPYGQQAWLENKVEVQWFEGDSTLDSAVINAIEMWSENNELVILATTLTALTPETLSYRMAEINEAIAHRDFVALSDHPLHPITTQSHTNLCNGKYALVLLQRLSLLQQASQNLQRLGYYDDWSDEDFERTVVWRDMLIQKSSK